MPKAEKTQRGADAAACTLPGAGLTERFEAWRALAARALSREAGPGWIASVYPRALHADLRALIEAEAECCPFLSFEVRERGDLVEVELRFPPESEPMVSGVTGGGVQAPG